MKTTLDWHPFSEQLPPQIPGKVCIFSCLDMPYAQLVYWNTAHNMFLTNSGHVTDPETFDIWAEVELPEK